MVASSLPLNVLVEARPCVVVGEVAVRDGKVQALADRGARVTVVAPEVTPDVLRLARDGVIELHTRRFSPGDLEGAFFVVCGHEDRSLNEPVWQEARTKGILINCVDDTARCTAIFPAIVRRGDLQVAVSTDGASPAVAVRIKQRLEAELGEEYGVLLDILGRARPLLAGWRTQARRAEVWRSMAHSDLLELIRSGRADEAERQVLERIRLATAAK